METGNGLWMGTVDCSLVASRKTTEMLLLAGGIGIAAAAAVVASAEAGSDNPKAAAMVSLLALAICALVSVAARTQMP